ncbi:hypothetical protein AVEN_263334-1 [Araneus ventricosus]|uniref:Uncharacterized protein n=1 Tax=Araneus ventricosus TaxID=182803 RepID=A0A4Y2D3A0_ARAVE|nr:hypothetical protein AVEN_263334-1 [Araneus ventricosus]
MLVNHFLRGIIDDIPDDFSPLPTRNKSSVLDKGIRISHSLRVNLLEALVTLQIVSSPLLNCITSPVIQWMAKRNDLLTCKGRKAFFHFSVKISVYRGYFIILFRRNLKDCKDNFEGHSKYILICAALEREKWLGFFLQHL